MEHAPKLPTDTLDPSCLLQGKLRPTKRAFALRRLHTVSPSRVSCFPVAVVWLPRHDSEMATVATLEVDSDVSGFPDDDVGDVVGMLQAAEEVAGEVEETAGIEEAIAGGASLAAEKAFGQIPGIGAIPGLSNLAASAAGAGAKALSNLFGSLFKKKKRPKKVKPKTVSPAKRQVMREAAKNPRSPAHAADVAVMASRGYDVEAAKRQGKLPSQMASRPGFSAQLRRVQESQGGNLERAFASRPVGERAVLGVAAATGVLPEALQGLDRIARVSAMANEEDGGEMPSVDSQDVVEQEQVGNDVAMPLPSYDAQVEVGGFDVATVERSPHLQVWKMPYEHHVMLLTALPALRELPFSTRELMTGQKRSASDTSGLSVRERSVYAGPGETAEHIASRLTGDPANAVELRAANPSGTKNGKWLIPPAWMSFDLPLGETGAVSTLRSYTVKKDDTPGSIAKRSGAMAAFPSSWWSDLKAANPEKKTKDNGANWASLNVGEIIGIPDKWPPSDIFTSASSGSGSSSGAPPGWPSNLPWPPVPSQPAPSQPSTPSQPAPSQGATGRTYQVVKDDTPEKIAKKYGAFSGNSKWWQEFRTANPLKPVKLDGSNWLWLYENEVLRIPDSWPAISTQPSQPAATNGAPPGWPSNLPWPPVPSQPAPSQPSGGLVLDGSQLPFPVERGTKDGTVRVLTPGGPVELPYKPGTKPGTVAFELPPFGKVDNVVVSTGSTPSQPAPTNGAPPGWPANWPWPPLPGLPSQPSTPSQPAPSIGAPPGWPSNLPWPPPVPSLPGTQTQPQSVEQGVVYQAQGILAFWGKMHSEDGGAGRVHDYGMTVTEFSGVMTPRTVQQLVAWQKWWNLRGNDFLKLSNSSFAGVPEKGELDATTWAWLKYYAEKIAPLEVPKGTTPNLDPAPPRSPYDLPWTMSAPGTVPAGGGASSEVPADAPKPSGNGALIGAGLLAAAQFGGLLKGVL